jgi:uroporphyrinogen decarboxylase
MNSKTRVHAALKHQPVDRPPIWMWFHPDTARRLASRLEIPVESLADVMGDDIRQAWVGNNFAMEGIVHERDGDTHLDEWGIEWVKDGPFNQIRRSPLEQADEEAIRRYAFPIERIPELTRNLKPLASASPEVFVGGDVSPCLFEMVCRLRGMEPAILDLAANPERAGMLLERAAAFSIRLAETACDHYPLDWLWTGDDVGGQQAMIMSPSCWRDTIRPLLARIFQVGKSRGLWVAYHSCGAIRPIVPDLIEMGLNVLNPVQGNCPGMDPLELKKEFGKDLAFMGGVDTHRLLPQGTADEVYGETSRLVEGMTADGGGYILAASHTVPPETPLENIFALYRAAGVTREEIFDRAAEKRRSIHS